MLAAVAACIAASIARPAKSLGRAGGDKKNIVRLHGHIRRFGLEDLLQLNRSFAYSAGSAVDDSGTAKISGASRTARQSDRLQHRQMPAVHEKSTRPSDIAHHVNQVGFADDDRVAGQDCNIALRVVAHIARERNANGFIGLIAMRDGDASTGLVGESASS